MHDAIDRITAVDLQKPLHGGISLENGIACWSLGPYDHGQYYFASPLIGRYPVAKTGEIKTVVTDFSFNIQYESSQGWVTASPTLHVQRGQPVNWERR